MNTFKLSKRIIYQLIAQEMPWESNLNRPDKDYPIVQATRALLEKSNIDIARDYSFMIIRNPSLDSSEYKDIENCFNWFKNRSIIKHDKNGVYNIINDRFKERIKRLIKK